MFEPTAEAYQLFAATVAASPRVPPELEHRSCLHIAGHSSSSKSRAHPWRQKQRQTTRWIHSNCQTYQVCRSWQVIRARATQAIVHVQASAFVDSAFTSSDFDAFLLIAVTTSDKDSRTSFSTCTCTADEPTSVYHERRQRGRGRGRFVEKCLPSWTNEPRFDTPAHPASWLCERQRHPAPAVHPSRHAQACLGPGHGGAIARAQVCDRVRQQRGGGPGSPAPAQQWKAPLCTPPPPPVTHMANPLPVRTTDDVCARDDVILVGFCFQKCLNLLFTGLLSQRLPSPRSKQIQQHQRRCLRSRQRQHVSSTSQG